MHWNTAAKLSSLALLALGGLVIGVAVEGVMRAENSFS